MRCLGSRGLSGCVLSAGNLSQVFRVAAVDGVNRVKHREVYHRCRACVEHRRRLLSWNGERREHHSVPLEYDVFAWTETKWNAWPFYQGWGSARFPRDGYYVIPSLASKQKYVVWLTTLDGKVHKRTGIAVADCKATPLSFRI